MRGRAHPSDGTCKLEFDHRLSAFPRLTALPPLTRAAALAAGSPAAAAAVVDASGSVLVPLDWRRLGDDKTMLTRAQRRERSRSVLAAIGRRLGTSGGLDRAHVGIFTPWGRPLPPMAAGDDRGGATFDDLEIGLTVVRISPRLCSQGSADGRACRSDSDCGQGRCADAVFPAPSLESSFSPLMLTEPAATVDGAVPGQAVASVP